MEKVEIVDGIELEIEGPAAQERFIQMFKKVWKEIPQIERDMILDFWTAGWIKNAPPAVKVCNDSTKFNLETMTLGVVNCDGIFFWADAIDTMPDEVVQSLIAHELGHVYQGIFPYLLGKGNLTDDQRNFLEYDANQHSLDWGQSVDVRENFKSSLYARMLIQQGMSDRDELGI